MIWCLLVPWTLTSSKVMTCEPTAHEIDQLRGALIAMREYYRQHMITPALYNQVEDALSLSNETSSATGGANQH